ncbi:unnamed protein product [Musa hybrid cultivar]
MASEASGEPFLAEAKGAPMRSEPDEDAGGDGAPRAAVEPEKESSDASPPASAAAGDTLTTTSSIPVAQDTPDDDPDEEAFQEALEDGDDDGVDGLSDAAKSSGSTDDVELMEGEEKGEPPSETQVFATVQDNSQHEIVEMVSSENPRTEETSHGEVLAAVVKESVENSTSQSTETKPIEDGAVVAGGVDGDEEVGLHDAREGSDEDLVEESGESAVPTIDAVEEERHGAEPDVVDEVKIGVALATVSDQNVYPACIPATEEMETVENPTLRIESNPVEDETSAAGNVDRNVEQAEPDDQGKDGSLVDNLGEPATPVVNVLLESKTAEDEFDTSEEGTGGGKANTDEFGSVLSNSSIQETVDETLTKKSDQAANESEANNDEPVPELVPEGENSISVQDRQSPSITAGESRNRVTERDEFGASGANEDGTARLPTSVTEPEPTPCEDLTDHVQDLDQEKAEDEDENLVSDGPPRVAILASSETAKQLINELEDGSSSVTPHSALDGSKDVDGQIILDSDEELMTDEEDGGNEMIDSDALVALLKAASSSTADGGISVTSQDANRIFLVDRPAGLGSSIPSLKPAPRPARSNLLSPSELAVAAEPDNQMTEEQKKLHEKVELIRVKFLRLVHRLGHSPEDTVVAQVLYRLSLAEGIRSGRQTSRAYSLESAKMKALLLEQDVNADLDFSCNILVLGKSGVGKSATINSIFGEEKSPTNAFKQETTSVKEIVGTVEGVKIRVLDTPGLRASGMDQASSRRILASIKKYTKRCPPDIVLYVDRMDTLTRDQNDLPLLRTITSTLGSSIWFNAIVALTHAASAPPDGPSGSPLSYEVFVAQRSHAVQQSIRLAAGDMRLMNPVALVENHPSCRRNREGQKVLPNGLSWRPQMLLLCYSSKILSEANSLLKLQDPSPGKLFGLRLRPPPLPFLLSSLLQSRAHPKLQSDQHGDNEDSDIDLDDLSDADQGEQEDEYDQLPPFKPLRKSQIAKLTKEQRRAYFDEYDYRVKLLQKKQWKEELRRLKEMKNRQKGFEDDFGHADMVEDFDQDNSPATIPVPLPDMVLPPSFDCDTPTYRYRFLEPTSQFLARPVLDTHGWDHDCGYDGVSLEESLAVAGRFPAVLSAQVTKDKKEFSIHLDSSVSAKHGENGSTLAGFDVQAVGKQLAYILRGETKSKILKKNRTTGGISVTFLGETIATGLKFEDQLSIGKQVNLVASTGAVRAQGYTAYGANLEVRLRDKDYPISQALATLGLSLMSWHGDLALGANLQSQFSIGRNSKMAVRVGLNNKRTGQITVRTSTSEQLQLALVGIIPIAISIFRSMKPGESTVLKISVE